MPPPSALERRMPQRRRFRVSKIPRAWAAEVLLAAAALQLTGCGSTASVPPAAPAYSTYSVGGSIRGLTGSGLVLINGTDQLSVAVDAAVFTLPTPVMQTSAYAVTVERAPPGLDCSVLNGTGTVGASNVTNVNVVCSAQAFSVAGSIAGLSAAGLVLANAAEQLVVAEGATSFALAVPVSYGSSYAVTVQTAPAGLNCGVANGAGVMGTTGVTNVVVTCSAKSFSVGGSISGLSAAGLVLANGPDELAVTEGATMFTMPTPVPYAGHYGLTVQSAPAGLTCSLANATGSMGTANVNNAVVTCSQQSFALGGSISGLNGAGLVLANGTNQLRVAAGASTFNLAAVAFSSGYAVTVMTQPSGVTCAVIGGTGTMPAAAVTSVAVTCSDQPYGLGGSISGLQSAGLVLANGTDRLAVASGSSSFSLPTPVAFASSYAVTVATQPIGMTCTVSAAAGLMPAANVSTVSVVCAAQAYALGGAITGLNGSGLELANGADRLSVAAGAGSFTMPAAVAYGSAYAVTVAAQPTGLTCSVSAGSGSMPAASVASVQLVCSDQAYTLGGSISALTGSGLVLTDGTDWLAVAANASVFSMPTGVAYTSNYDVTVAAQPAPFNCAVTAGSGTMPAANVTSVQVSCVARYWTWLGGATGLSAHGVYGTQDVAASGNVPGARLGAMTWNGTTGQRWLFGGTGFGSNATQGDLSDLWSFNETADQWTWLGGPNTVSGAGNYGTEGVAASGNWPGSRKNSMTWTDGSGTLWLFGGYHDNSNCGNLCGYLNDLWSYNPGTGLWTWVTGSSATNGGNASCTNALGVYGTRAAAAAGNTPGARLSAVTWIDSAGNLWLHGGFGCDSVGTLGNLNDLWSYKPSTNAWTWVGGSTLVGAGGVYGTQGVAAAANVPGARAGHSSWQDGTGRFWLFGGYGADSTDTAGNLNDLWSYDPATNAWVWVTGSATGNASGVYGATGNAPGGRNQAQAWIDSHGKLLLFGGNGVDSEGNGGWLNDLWSYDPTAHQWTWVNGSSTINNVGVYGSLGAGAAANVPGARFQSVGWINASDHVWVFGGYGRDHTTADYYGALNDVFEY